MTLQYRKLSVCVELPKTPAGELEVANVMDLKSRWNTKLGNYTSAPSVWLE